MELNQRETEILSCIIETYIDTAQPVGSRTVSARSRLELSAASVRNAMADLTDKGYLHQPHTSAGRVPTAMAFRRYLDSIMEFNPLPENVRDTISRHLSEAGYEYSDILRETSRLLSRLSSQVSMVMAPRRSAMRWKRIEFNLVKQGLALAVLVLQGGILQQRILKVDSSITSDDLTKYANYLNELFADRTVGEARAHIITELRGARRRLSQLCRSALQIAHDAFHSDSEEIIVDGTVNILAHPEFSNAESLRELLDLLNERSKLLELLDTVIDTEGPTVLFAPHIAHAEVQNYSLVSSTYSVHGEPLGVVGVLGPLRMNYASVVPVVEYTAKRLAELITKQF